jgi:hypothetical protein
MFLSPIVGTKGREKRKGSSILHGQKRDPWET